MSDLVLQKRVPYPALTPRALPSLQVMDPAEWLIFDEAEAGQLALRRSLLAHERDRVLAAHPGSEAAQAEAVRMIAAHLREHHGREVRARELRDLAGLIQEDIVILEKRGGAHVMTAALLCFPASWLLAEKIGRPMAVIHEPVAEIDTRMDRQIERVFEAVRADRPMWRYNQLWYHDAALFQPRSAGDRREKPKGQGDYLRTERQCLVRMPETGGLIFSIHTYVVAREDVEVGGAALFA
ncbi:MAG: DUF3445 domain-containing protein [Pseudomonadota bacterium]